MSKQPIIGEIVVNRDPGVITPEDKERKFLKHYEKLNSHSAFVLRTATSFV